DILVVDEVLAVGDEAFQRRCMERINALRAAGRTLLFVSHALEQVRSVCDRCLWMDHGQPRELGRADPVLQAYRDEVNRREEVALQRSGSGEVDASPGREGVSITSIAYSGGEGRAAVFNTGDPLTIAIGYEAPQALGSVRFVVSFVREDGTVLVTVPTDDMVTTRRPLPARGVVRLSLEGLPFLQGLYQVTVEVCDIATGRPYKRLERVQPFRVHSSERREVGMALLGHSWDLPGVPTEVGTA
ncbi:MAG: Wzt carbohydrate-binding domain-containing protein, partial [Candidatus Dormibacteria bacterium]